MAKAKQKLGPLQEELCRALESGEFPQGTSYLFRKTQRKDRLYRHCCLGVACLVAEANGVELVYCNIGNVSRVRHLLVCGAGEPSDNASSEALPDVVQARMKFHTDVGGFRDEERRVIKYQLGDDLYTSLAGANDNGVPFQVIAAFIRANPHLVFSGAA